jgi:hypothetical protein
MVAAAGTLVYSLKIWSCELLMEAAKELHFHSFTGAAAGKLSYNKHGMDFLTF